MPENPLSEDIKRRVIHEDKDPRKDPLVPPNEMLEILTSLVPLIRRSYRRVG